MEELSQCVLPLSTGARTGMEGVGVWLRTGPVCSACSYFLQQFVIVSVMVHFSIHLLLVAVKALSYLVQMPQLQRLAIY